MKNSRLSAKTVFLYTLMLGAAVIFLFIMLGDYSGFVKTYKAELKSRPRALPPARQIPPRAVRFNFTGDNAQQVLLHADFNHWGATEIALEKISQNTFSKTLVLPPGEYKYYFIVDGRPAQDEGASNNIIYEGRQVSIKTVL